MFLDLTGIAPVHQLSLGYLLCAQYIIDFPDKRETESIIELYIIMFMIAQAFMGKQIKIKCVTVRNNMSAKPKFIFFGSTALEYISYSL